MIVSLAAFVQIVSFAPKQYKHVFLGNAKTQLSRFSAAGSVLSSSWKQSPQVEHGLNVGFLRHQHIPHIS